MSNIEIVNLWKVFGNDPEIVFEPENINKTRSEIQDEFNQVVALRNVNLSINPGETFVVMGLSGSGKSTLVRALIRLIDPTSGSILINNQDVLQYNNQELENFRRHTVAMVFQHFGLFPHRTVLENAAYGLEVQKVDTEARNQKALEVLELVGLSGWESSYPSELSGGMQQRVGIARALAVEPDILLMDEPFSGLDPLIRRQMRIELKKLQQTIQKTIVFITHDLDEAITVGDRIAIMRDGEVTQLGTPEEIVTNPANSFVEEFTFDIPKTRVTSVSNIMVKPSSQEFDRRYVVTPESIVEDMIPLVLETGDPIPVVDSKDELVGVVPQEKILELVAQSARQEYSEE
tara:strand:+ start:1168 stop:2208 length:1041 start_codon:yes stop_codon:yes gene_type:complete